MTNKTKERIALMAECLIDLSDTGETCLQQTIELIGINTIHMFLGMDYLDFEVSRESLMEDICDHVDWHPVLTAPGQTDEELNRIGLLIADLIEDTNPFNEAAAESLYEILRWCGLRSYLEINSGAELG